MRHFSYSYITETKIDSSFLSNQFLINGFSKPFRFDRNRFGGGVLLYVRSDVTCKQLFLHEFPDDIEGIFIELSLNGLKWLLFETYHPPKQPDHYYFENVSKALDRFSVLYEKFILIGDFNSEDSEPDLFEF